jgi:hypothetical protein
MIEHEGLKGIKGIPFDCYRKQIDITTDKRQPEDLRSNSAIG